MSSFKILICGDRFWAWDKVDVIRSALLPFKPGTVVIHGGARGVDTWGHRVANGLGFDVESFPAKWERYGKSAGPIRNTLMLRQRPDLVLAFHDRILASTGTLDMVNRALKAGVKVVLYRSNGERAELGRIDKEGLKWMRQID